MLGSRGIHTQTLTIQVGQNIKTFLSKETMFYNQHKQPPPRNSVATTKAKSRRDLLSRYEEYPGET